MADRRFCGDGSTVRIIEGSELEWICLPPADEMQMVPDLKCFNECGNLVPCLSPLTPIVLNGKANTLLEELKKTTSTDCSKTSIDACAFAEEGDFAVE